MKIIVRLLSIGVFLCSSTLSAMGGGERVDVTDSETDIPSVASLPSVGSFISPRIRPMVAARRPSALRSAPVSPHQKLEECLNRLSYLEKIVLDLTDKFNLLEELIDEENNA